MLQKFRQDWKAWNWTVRTGVSRVESLFIQNRRDGYLFEWARKVTRSHRTALRRPERGGRWIARGCNTSEVGQSRSWRAVKLLALSTQMAEKCGSDAPSIAKENVGVIAPQVEDRTLPIFSTKKLLWDSMTRDEQNILTPSPPTVNFTLQMRRS